MTHRTTLAAVLLAALPAGCARREPAPESPEIAVLRRDLAHEFQADVPEVEMEDASLLEITFDDPALARLSRDDKSATAQKVMEYVRDHYAPFERLAAVKVGFASGHGLGGVKFDLHSTFTRSRGAIGAAAPDEE